jgi:hypothetical protein
MVGRTLRVSRPDLEQNSFFRRLGRDASPYLLKFLSAYLILASVVLLFASGCGTPPTIHRVDAELDRNAAAAKSAYAAGALTNADIFYAKALNRARLTDQGADIARMAYNLAACRAQEQKYTEALKLLDEARFESEQAGLSMPEIQLLRAEILLRLEQTDEAAAVANAGIKTSEKQKDKPATLQFNLFLAELACDRNDAEQALKELDKIDQQTLAEAPLIIRAKATAARGRALLIKKQFSEAAGCFDNAAALYRQAQRYADMAVALDNAGNAYATGMKRPEALNRYYRAARSLLACGDKTKGQDALNKAKTLATELQDKEMAEALARLPGE